MNRLFLQLHWSYESSVSTTAWDAFGDVQNIIDDVCDMTHSDPSNFDTNGLFGKIMSVSVVAHNAYSDMLALTGRIDINYF